MLKDITLNEFENGWCSFHVDVKTGLDIWARLANIDYRWNMDFRSCMAPRNLEHLKILQEWACMILRHSFFVEGEKAPLVSIIDGESNFTLQWTGFWTPGREVHVDVYPQENVAVVRFNTGTGKDSTFLTELFESSVAENSGRLIPKELAYRIRSRLGSAYGGLSQLTPSIYVAAVCGHVYNGYLCGGTKEKALEVVREILLLDEEQWGSDILTPEEYVRAEEEVAACWEKANRPVYHRQVPPEAIAKNLPLVD